MSDFYTVAQYALLLSKDPGNIRRMLAKGEIQGEKVGNQWLIPKDAKYPDDKRVRSGVYKNWRKSTRVRNAHPALSKSLQNMSEKLSGVYGAYLEKIVLYGSYARGDQTDASDVDIALFVREGSSEMMHDQMTDIVVDYELDLGVTLSVITIESDEYDRWHKVHPFFKNIDKEGIVLWRSA